MKKKNKIKYVSVKLPADSRAYALDSFGSPKLPDYTDAYLRKHGQKLFEILLNQVPASVYSELVKCIKKQENLS